MGLGFLLRRCAPSTTPRTRAASVALGSISALFSSAGGVLPPQLLRFSLLPGELSGGPGTPTLTRHLHNAAAAATECAHAHPESRQSAQSDLWGAAHGGRPDGFRGGGVGSSTQNVDGFHRGNPGEVPWIDPEASLRGGSGVVRRNPDAYHGGSPVARDSNGGGLSEQNFGRFGRGSPGETSVGANSDGFSSRGQWSPDGFRRGSTQGANFGAPQSSQQNLGWHAGGNPGEAYVWNPNADQGSYGFSGSPSGEIQSTSGPNYAALAADESAEVAGSNSLRGTVDELEGFLQEGKAKEAVEVLHLLEKQGMVLDLPRYLRLMHVCGDAKALEEARFVHDHVLRTSENLEVKVQNRILDMYCKCGSMDDAYEWFDKMPGRNFTSWDMMIMGLADNGLGEDAIDLFNRFLQMGLKPDGCMFITVFHVCSTLGAVDEGILHFESMSKVHGITPTMEHYVSIADMLGQTGYLDEAVDFIEMMPIEPSVDVWESLMNCCRLQGHVELGDRCAEIVEILDPSRLTSQSKAGLLPVKDSDLAKEREKKKANILEVRSRVHEYRAGDTSHPEKDRIYALIKALAVTLRESGYVPDTRFVLHDIDQESKEEALLAHSERLATAYALISSAVRSPIRVIKNLRICGDCHSYMKIVSKLVGRELIIRDAKRFHHFKDGACSCRDYW